MICYCSKKHGGAGRNNTPIAWHLYDCVFYLDQYGIEYEIFSKEYNKYKDEYSDEEIVQYVVENYINLS